ncbi:MAG: DUF6485 family protein [bacterium]
MQCKQEKNSADCPCTYPGCPRKGLCCECLRHHLQNKELPACCFSIETEKTYNRSIQKFLDENK